MLSIQVRYLRPVSGVSTRLQVCKMMCVLSPRVLSPCVKPIVEKWNKEFQSLEANLDVESGCVCNFQRWYTK